MILKDPSAIEDKKYLISNAIAVKLIDENGEFDDEIQSKINEKLRWEITDFSKDQMTLKFFFNELDFVDFDDFVTFELTFWGTKYFIDSDKRELSAGTQIKWKIFR